jgi:hypothetical protein
MSARIAIVAFVICCHAGGVLAQGIQTSALTGTIRDSSGAVVPGAEILLSGTRLIGGERRVESDSSGTYRFLALPPGDYVVRARVAGFADDVRASIQLAVGLTLTIDLVVRPSTVETTIDVHDVTPLIDVRNPAASTRINVDFLENLPSKRVFEDLLNLAPGVTAAVGFGGTQRSNALYVDGVQTSDPSLGTPYLRFNQNWLEQVEIAALGAPLEFSGTTGVSANAILRSGSNIVHGLFEGLTTRPSWLARNTRGLSEQLQRNFAPLELIRWWDVSGQLGGPVLRDRVWYFGGVESFVHEKRPAGYSGPGTQTTSDTRNLVKITSALRPGMRLEGFIQHGSYKNASEDLGALTPPDGTYDWRQPQTVWQSRFTWTPRTSTMVEAQSAGFRSDGHMDPHPPATREGPPSRVDQATGVITGNAFSVGDFNRSRLTTSAIATHYRAGLLGRHEIRGGVEHERAWMQSWNGPAAGMSFTDENGVPIRVTTWEGQTLEAWTNRLSLFVADIWQIGRVSLSPGLRLDANRGSVPLARNVYRTTPLAPSLGVVWDARENHTLALRAHVGSSFDPVFIGRVSTIDLSHRNARTEYRILPSGQWVLQRVIPAPTTINTTISPNIDAARVDQFMGGAEWQVHSDFSAEANVVYRRFSDFVGMYEVNRRWRPTQARDPGLDDVLGTADDGDFLTVYAFVEGATAFVYGNVPDAAIRQYRALQLVGRKRLSDGWQAQVSYTWPHTWGTVSNLALTNSGVNDLGTSGGYADPNSFINNEGIAAFDPREFKVLADAVLPYLGGFTIGGVYRYYSGQTWARRATLRYEDHVKFVFVEPRGSRRLPPINNLDLRIEKSVRFRNVRLGLSADVFNATNQGVPNSDSTFPNPINFHSGPSFGVPGAWVDPRLLRVGIRLIF